MPHRIERDLCEPRHATARIRRGAAPGEPGLAPRPVLAPGPGLAKLRRERYVLGTFATPGQANGAVARLLACDVRLCDILVLSSLRMDGHSCTDGHANALQELRFRGGRDGTPGMGRLLESIARHVSDGATVVVVSVSDFEQQMDASRSLLDAKCDVLLTHEMRPSQD